MRPRTPRRSLAFLAGTLLLGTGLAAASPALPAGAATPEFITYDTPGTYAYTVPNGVTAVHTLLRGADGGTSRELENYGGAPGGAGGLGGVASGNLSVTPGQTLTVVVGGQGVDLEITDGLFKNDDTRGGYNGGGNGGVNYAAGGGGASDIRTSSTDLSTRLLVAAGGGGGTAGRKGGDAEAFGTPIDGYCTVAASPGTQTRGGDGVRCDEREDGTNGTFGKGGDGGVNGRNDAFGATFINPAAAGGGGGGGGWFGGGGGHGGQSDENTPGAGGSNHVADSVTNNSTGIATSATGNGFVKIAPANITAATAEASPARVNVGLTTTVTVTVDTAVAVQAGDLSVTFSSDLGNTFAPSQNPSPNVFTTVMTPTDKVGTAVVTATITSGGWETHTATIDIAQIPAPNLNSVTTVADLAAIRANGTAQAIITTTVLDANGDPAPAQDVQVVIPADGPALNGPTLDNGNGTYTSILTSSEVIGTFRLSTTVNGTPDVVFTKLEQTAPGPAPDLRSASTLADVSSIPADGKSKITLSTNIVDIEGEPSPGQKVEYILPAGGPTLNGPVRDNGDGSYTATLVASTTAKVYTIGTAINGTQTDRFTEIQLYPLPTGPYGSLTGASQLFTGVNGTIFAVITLLLALFGAAAVLIVRRRYSSTD